MSDARKLDTFSLPEGTLIDGWRVVRRVDSGGFGAVHVVEQHGQRCAMKLALRRPEDDSANGTKRFFQRELVILARLMNVPNIARLEGCGYWRAPGQGQPYVLMEYVDGECLSDWARRHNPTFRELARVFAKLAAALGKAHELGIFHRDIKPANILVRGKDSEPVIVDFGSGDFAQAQTLTEGGMRPPGTPGYRSPELVAFYRKRGLTEDQHYEFKPTDDLYSLGMCLYEVLTETNPFRPTDFYDADARRGAEMLVEVHVPRTARKLNPRVPEAMSRLVERLMSKGARDRPPTDELLSRLLLELAEAGDPEWDMGIYPPVQVQPAEEAPVPAPAPPPQPPAEAPVEPEAEPARAHLAWALLPVLGLSVLLMLAAFLRSRTPEEPEQAPRSLETADLSLLLPNPATGQAPASPALSKETEPVKTANNVVPAPVAPAPEQSPQRQPRRSTLAARCSTLVATSALFVKLGCAGAQLRPPGGDCPPDSDLAMESFGLRYDTAFLLDIDVNQPGGHKFPPNGIFRVGKIVSATRYAHRELPAGTKFYGQLYFDPDAKKMWARWTEAATPGAEARIPVCVTLANYGVNEDFGQSVAPGSKPDAIISRRTTTVVVHWGKWPSIP